MSRMENQERKIRIAISRAADDAFPEVRGRVMIGEEWVGRADFGSAFMVSLPAGDYALIAETEENGELDGAALRLTESEMDVTVTLRAMKAAEGHRRIMIDCVERKAR